MASETVSSSAGLWPNPDTGPWSITLEWSKLGGRMECVGVSIRSVPADLMDPLADLHKSGEASPQAISATVWREVPIASIIDRDRASTVEWLGEGRGPGFTQSEWTGRSRPPRHDPEEVAGIYLDAWRRGQQPTKAVAEALTISRSAAAKQVAKARALGFLPPTSRGKAIGGES